jgi:hypothetical protein
MTFSQTKENSILENFACEEVLKMFNNSGFLTATKIMNSLYSYSGGRQKLLAFLKNEEYFTSNKKTNGALFFKATDTFKSLLQELLEDTNDFMSSNIVEFDKAVSL